MPQGSITDFDRDFVETWECIAVSAYDVIKLDRRGDEVHEIVQGRKKFMIRSEERILTQSRILDEKNDPFLNGSFRPIVVPDSISIESNPNALADEEIQQIFVASELAWDEWVKVIDSPDTLRRMIDLAEGADISLKRYKALQARLVEVQPKVRVTQKDIDEYGKMSSTSEVVEQDDSRDRSKPKGRGADYRNR